MADTLVVACGALARELTVLARHGAGDCFDVRCIDARLHNRPAEIPGRVEEAIANGEGRKAELEAAMANPEFFKNKEEAAAGAAEYREVAAAIERAYTEWSEVSDEIERVEAEFAAKMG